MIDSPPAKPHKFTKDELQQIRLSLAKDDPTYRYEHHYWIKDGDGHTRPIGRLKLAQRKTLAVLNYCRERKLPARIIIAKSRKQGESTIIAADCLDLVMERQIDAIVLAHDKETARYIFDIYARFYKNYDLPKPELYKGKTNKREMRFDDHDGRVEVETANNPYAGTGRTPQYIHASESSKWEKGNQTLVSLLQSMGDSSETTLIHESTFNGSEATFLPLWEGAVKHSTLTFGDNLEVKFEVTNAAEWNHYIPLFISVLDDDSARRAFQSEEEAARFEQTLDEYERNARDVHGASLEFLNWRRYAIRHKCQGDIAIFKQEFPITWQEAVRASGRPRFSIEKLDTHPIEKGEVGTLKQEEKWARKIKWNRDPGDLLTVFRHPVPGHRYVFGIDTAEGILDDHGRDSDNSVGIVLDIDRGGEQVATYCGKVAPEVLLEPSLLIAGYYNEVFVIPEGNSTGAVLAVGLGQRYPNEKLFHRDDWDESKTRHSRQIGWRTHTGTRNHLISELAEAILDNSILLHDERTIMECKRFVWKQGGRAEADSGYHDDHVFALALAVMGMKHYPRMQDPLERARAVREAQKARESANRITGY